MSKLTTKIITPMLLVGIFSMVALIAISYEQLSISFYIIAFFLVIFMFFYGLSVGQKISSPVKKILENAKELSGGNLSSRVYLETKDELAELARDFNKIAEELEKSHEQEENTEKSIDIKVRARTQALEETIDALEQKVKNRTIQLERLIEASNKLQETLKDKK